MLKRISEIWILFLCLGCAKSSDAIPSGSSNSSTRKQAEPEGVSSQIWSGLVNIDSEYKDESNPALNRKLKIGGSGYWFKVKDRNFVISAAHVASGENLKLNLASTGEPLEIIKIYPYHKADFILIEIKTPSIEEVVRFDGRVFLVNLTVNNLNAAPPFRARRLDISNLVPLSNRVQDSNLSFDNGFAKLYGSKLYLDPFSNLLNSDSVIMPGTSGSPLLSYISESDAELAENFDIREGVFALYRKKVVIRGLVIRRERYMPLTTLIPVHKLKSFVRKIFEETNDSERSYDEPTTWHLSESVIFRRNGRLSETAVLTGATSGSLVSDVGNGVSMYGGDEESLFEDAPVELQKRISAFPTYDNKISNFWILAMRSPVNSRFVSMPMWFDMEYRLNLAQFGFSLEMPAEFKIGSGAAGNLMLAKEPKFKIGCEAKLHYEQGQMHFEIALPNADFLNFSLDADGHLCTGTTCDDQFRALLELSTQKGKSYVADIRHLYFVDFSRFRGNMFRVAERWKTDQEYNELFDMALREAQSSSTLIVRPKVQRGSNRPLRLSEFDVQTYKFRVGETPCYQAL